MHRDLRCKMATVDSIDAAIESAESLIASLLVRERSVSLSEGGVVVPNGSCQPGDDMLDSASEHQKQCATQDPEASLFSPVIVDQSLVTEGTASLWPTTVTASSQATLPEYFGLISPKESLHALVNKVSESSQLDSPDYGTLERLLHEREKDLEVAAKIGQVLLHHNEALEIDLSKCVEQRNSLEHQLRQIQHTVSRKEELLRLYASEQEEQPPSPNQTTPNQSWVHVLTEECHELRESNLQLQEEADILRKETADVELKEKELVQQCLEQFTEAKRRLGELREESEQKQLDNQDLQAELLEMSEKLFEVNEKWHHLMEESDLLKDQLAIAQDQNHHFTQAMTELQEKLEETSVLLKESKDENVGLKEQAVQFSSSSSLGDSSQVEHESIVREIEEVLRMEIIAASTLPERPRSPNHYARQRTMVVMETVRAATLASQRKKERLSKEATKPSLPLAASSPSDKGLKKSGLSASINVCPPSPILHDTSGNLPEELVRYRNQTYVAPEKLQIVKPLEGSVTLLKWKLLASPQLGGATSFFADSTQPGVHRKKWKAGGVIDEGQSRFIGSKVKSLSTTDISSLSHDFSYPMSHHAMSGSASNTPAGKSDMDIAHKTCTRLKATYTPVQEVVGGESGTTSPRNSTSRSVMNQVGSFLGSGLSRFGFGSNTDTSLPTEAPVTKQDAKGLSALLDSC